MKKAFGHDFVLTSDVRQVLKPEVFGTTPLWIHLATVHRGLREYVAFMPQGGKTIYIEMVDPTNKNLFVKIEDDKEWADLYRFLMDSGCLVIIGQDKEFKIAL